MLPEKHCQCWRMDCLQFLLKLLYILTPVKDEGLLDWIDAWQEKCKQFFFIRGWDLNNSISPKEQPSKKSETCQEFKLAKGPGLRPDKQTPKKPNKGIKWISYPFQTCFLSTGICICHFPDMSMSGGFLSECGAWALDFGTTPPPVSSWTRCVFCICISVFVFLYLYFCVCISVFAWDFRGFLLHYPWQGQLSSIYMTLYSDPMTCLWLNPWPTNRSRPRLWLWSW